MTREERVRTDLAMRERGAWQQLQLQWDVSTCTQRYTSAQISELETELMWQEDILAHRLSLEHLQAELTRREDAEMSAAQSREQEALWKEKYHSLREASLLQVTELRAAHEDELQRTRLKYMRLSPDVSLLRYLILSGVKSHFNTGKLMIFVSNMQRKLLIAKEAFALLRQNVSGDLQRMASELRDVTRRCAPIEWVPVEQAQPEWSRQAATVSRQAATVQQHPSALKRSNLPLPPAVASVIVRAPQLSPRSRNAKVVVVRSPTRR
jgi:hypothetical protein